MLLGNSLRQTVHTNHASVHQAAKLVAALLRVAGVTAGLAEINGSLPPGLWLTSPAGWLPRTSSGTLHSSMGCLYLFTPTETVIDVFHQWDCWWDELLEAVIVSSLLKLLLPSKFCNNSFKAEIFVINLASPHCSWKVKGIDTLHLYDYVWHFGLEYIADILFTLTVCLQCLQCFDTWLGGSL